MKNRTAKMHTRRAATPAAAAVVRASMRMGWNIAEQPRSFRSFLDLACRYWLEVRRELGISRGDRSAQDTRDIHEFIGAAASAFAAAPLSCADLTGDDRDECLAVAGFARLMAADAALRALVGRHASSEPRLAANAVAAFQQGYAAARSSSN
jgi:hypothetical protein